MTKPQIKMDWTINITSLMTAILFVLSCATAWYNLKQEVAVNKAVSDVKFTQIDTSIVEVKTEIVKNTSEIKGDIKDLRSEVLGGKR